MKRSIQMTVGALYLLVGCAEVEGPRDPRLGEAGRVRFAGGGCAGSTTLPVGAKGALVMEAAEEGETLPAGLGVRSGAAGVITARLGDLANEIELEALAAGDARIEVLEGGAIFDAIVLHAAPAGSVEHRTVERVFAGGLADVVVERVFGACGNEDCEMFGHSFLEWRVEPAGAASFELDDEGAASFRAGAPGRFEAVGLEPTGGAELVRAGIDVVEVANIKHIHAVVTTLPLEEGAEPRVFPLPSEEAIVAGEYFCIRVEAEQDDGRRVPISRRDVSWSAGPDDVMRVLEISHGTEPLGTLFHAMAAGEAALEVDIPLLERDGAYTLRVVP